MTASWTKLRAEALDSTRALVEVLRDGESDVSTLIASYLESKSALASAFAQLAQERYGHDSALDDAIKLVRSALTALTDVPDRYRKVRSYSASHRILLSFLIRNVGKPVSAATLKMITGEQSETPRRTRELRTLGFDIEAIRTGGQDSYTLKSLEPDTSLGAHQQIALQIREDKDLSQQQRVHLLRFYGVDS